jgi:hypothetical protein
VIPEVEALLGNLLNEPPAVRTAAKRSLYDFFEFHLAAGDFSLGHGVGEFDTERRPIDTIVIHHTSNVPGLSGVRLSAIELMRFYGPYFANPPKGDRKLRGRPIFSGHEHDGRQVFWPYHWLIRGDGRTERLLSDSETGWHAGNWEINCRSIAIVLDGDYEHNRPSKTVLKSMADLIHRQYPEVLNERILGHCEITGKTTCPSRLFLWGRIRQGWKEELVSLVGLQRAA